MARSKQAAEVASVGTHHRFEKRTLGSLQLAGYNPRIISAEDKAGLRRSLLEFGVVEPLVIRQDGLIVGGHQRYAALSEVLTEMGQDAAVFEVPVIVVEGLDDRRTMMLNLALNRIRGDWDYPKLSDVFIELGVTPASLEHVHGLGFDPTLSGFGLSEMLDVTTMFAAELLPSPTSVQSIDPDEVLRKEALTFRFVVDSSTQAEFVQGMLRRFGMTGPKDQAAAFIKMVTAASRVAVVEGT